MTASQARSVTFLSASSRRQLSSARPPEARRFKRGKADSAARAYANINTYELTCKGARKLAVQPFGDF